MESIEKKIQNQINKNPILLYMKGNPEFPQCGFSAKVVKILQNCKKQFQFINVLEEPEIRKVLPKFSNWPTFPQLWVNGNLIGGCDIISEMFDEGELQTLLESIRS